jgi:hypothetical protein
MNFTTKKFLKYKDVLKTKQDFKKAALIEINNSLKKIRNEEYSF